jgi:hypothetical protein
VDRGSSRALHSFMILSDGGREHALGHTQDLMDVQAKTYDDTRPAFGDR